MKTAPNSAMPSVIPSCREVLIALPAIPARCGGTDSTAADTITGVATPTPTPTIARPAKSADCPEPSEIVRPIVSDPTAMSSSPPPIGTRGATPCRKRPDSAAATNAVPASGITASPPRTGLRPSTFWSHSETKTSPLNAAAW